MTNPDSMSQKFAPGAHQNRPRRTRRFAVWSLALASVFLMGVALYVAREPILVATARALTVDDAVRPADYLVVLGGGAETRPFEAANLHRLGYAPRVLIFQHGTDRFIDRGIVPPHHELFRAILVAMGVPPDSIQVVPGPVASSRDEAFSLRRFLTAHPARRVILVTNPEHSRRARWIFRKALAGISTDVRVAVARREEFDESNWWKHDVGALVYLHEYLKLPAYWLRFHLERGSHDSSAAFTSTRRRQ